eukprot:COSAG06_NODE_209_length_20178_cov_4.309478_12_plen_290_part_00
MLHRIGHRMSLVTRVHRYLPRAVPRRRACCRQRRLSLTTQRRALSSPSWLDPVAALPPVTVADVGLTRTAELDECIATCHAEVAAVIAHHRATGERYVDHDFPVRDPDEGWRCIYEHEHEVFHPPDLQPPPAWVRLYDTHSPSQLSLFDGEYAASGDIVQGSIGTCFFLGSLAAMAHGQKGWVRQLFVAHDVEAGVYGVRFFRGGCWQHVLVDDIIGYHAPEQPATTAAAAGAAAAAPTYSTPWFSHNSIEGTVWVAIIEKAYAKLCGSYETINTGHAREAMVDLSGKT